MTADPHAWNAHQHNDSDCYQLVAPEEFDPVVSTDLTSARWMRKVTRPAWCARRHCVYHRKLIRGVDNSSAATSGRPGTAKRLLCGFALLTYCCESCR